MITFCLSYVVWNIVHQKLAGRPRFSPMAFQAASRPTSQRSRLQSASIFTFILEEVVDVLAQLVVEGDVDDVAG